MRRVYHGGGIEYADGGGTGALADGKDGSLKLPEALVQLLSHLLGAKKQCVHRDRPKATQDSLVT